MIIVHWNPCIKDTDNDNSTLEPLYKGHLITRDIFLGPILILYVK